MNVPVGVSVIIMVVGVVAVLRAVAIVTTHGDGRFRADPLVTMVSGFALILLGQYLLLE